MTQDLTLTVYGLAESKAEMPSVIVFKNKTARLNWICEKRDDAFISEFDQEIDLSTVPAVAALVERVKVLDTLKSDLWDFIENVTDDDPERQDKFFALRERVRDVASPDAAKEGGAA